MLRSTNYFLVIVIVNCYFSIGFFQQPLTIIDFDQSFASILIAMKNASPLPIVCLCAVNANVYTIFLFLSNIFLVF